MSDKIGTINYEQESDDVFLGYDIGRENRHSEFISGEIDKEVRRIISECYAKAKEIIVAHEDVLHRSAALLIEREKITGEEFDAFEDGLITDAPEYILTSATQAFPDTVTGATPGGNDTSLSVRNCFITAARYYAQVIAR
jgi:hypothetical protein